MYRKDSLTEFEQLVLLALVRLGDDAYGVTIQEEIAKRTGRAASLAATYTALERLEDRGFVEAWISEPVAVRGGRSRKHFRIRKAGAAALRESQQAMKRMWQGLERHPDLRRS